MNTGSATLPGIHHVTAITADGAANVHFYRDIRGLRLVKKTVNFDEPNSYHLYYGDELGRPGTIMTFFVWPGGRRGRIGPPQVTETAFAVPMGALDFWKKRLEKQGVEIRPTEARFGDHLLAFNDPDGLRIEIIESPNPGGEGWTSGNLPADVAIRGFHSVSISEEGYEKTAHLLTDMLDFTLLGSAPAS
jgi:catechol 2,3-dioxygenase-like lactoylglutathione lyase family enzyme